MAGNLAENLAKNPRGPFPGRNGGGGGTVAINGTYTGTPPGARASSLDATAGRYYRVMALLFKEQGIRGKVVKQTRGARHLALGVRLADPRKLNTALALAEPLALGCGCPAVLAQRSQADPGLVAFQFQLAQRLWVDVTRGDVAGLGVGLSEGRRQIDFSFSPPHAGVFGTTDAGKSEAVKSILAALFSAHRPGELAAVVVDPNRDYDAFANCAHLAAPIDHGELQALTWAGQELARRVEANVKDGPRLVVVIDEAEEALKENAQGLEVARAIARTGRKYRVNLVLGTQDAKEKTLPGLVSLVNNRWVGLVANAQVSATLTGQAGVEAHKLTGHGDFTHVAGATVERLQIALVRPADLERLPRVETVAMPEVLPEDAPAVLNARGAGRPPVEVTPGKVATYLSPGPDNVSRAQAREHLALGRTAHEKHQGFARELREALDYLEEQEGGWME